MPGRSGPWTPRRAPMRSHRVGRQARIYHNSRLRITVRFVAREWDLLVVGDANPDLVLRGDVVPRFGQAEQWLTAADLVLAGSAGIVAAGAARLGVPPGIAAPVGSDAFGELVLDRLAERGVDVSLVAREPLLPTGLSVILSTPADRSILTLPGAIVRQRADEVPDEVLHRVRHLHV